ncbi:MAG: hypothetical protein CM15mV86_340 [uncultured marine virus]|nr:MAG: hypothetical protein CM15mV86_340 [uncultured marine virus]
MMPQKELGKAGNAEAIRSNLQDALRSTLITSKIGGDAVGAVSRRAVSTALLANPMNAVLNIVEGVTAPVFRMASRLGRKQCHAGSSKLFQPFLK